MTRVVPLSPAEITARLDDVMIVYGLAMGYPADLLATRKGYMGSHVNRRDFHAVGSFDDDGAPRALRCRAR